MFLPVDEYPLYRTLAHGILFCRLQNAAINLSTDIAYEAIRSLTIDDGQGSRLLSTQSHLFALLQRRKLNYIPRWVLINYKVFHDHPLLWESLPNVFMIVCVSIFKAFCRVAVNNCFARKKWCGNGWMLHNIVQPAKVIYIADRFFNGENCRFFI